MALNVSHLVCVYVRGGWCVGLFVGRFMRWSLVREWKFENDLLTGRLAKLRTDFGFFAITAKQQRNLKWISISRCIPEHRHAFNVAYNQPVFNISTPGWRLTVVNDDEVLVMCDQRVPKAMDDDLVTLSVHSNNFDCSLAMCRTIHDVVWCFFEKDKPWIDIQEVQYHRREWTGVPI